MELRHVIEARNGFHWSIVLGAFIMASAFSTTAEAQTSMDIQVISTRTDYVFSEVLNDQTSYVYALMNTTMCTDVLNAVATAGSVSAITVESFEDALPGVRATIKMTVALDGLTESDRLFLISNAIVSAATTNVNWVVSATDITAYVPSTDGISVAMRIMSTRTEFYYTTVLNEPTSFTFQLMNITMCADVIDAVSSVQTVELCYVESFSDAAPGVKASIRLTTVVFDLTENEGFLQAANAIVAAASLRTTWIVGLSDITLLSALPPVQSGCSCLAQLPLSCLLVTALRKLI